MSDKPATRVVKGIVRQRPIAPKELKVLAAPMARQRCFVQRSMDEQAGENRSACARTGGTHHSSLLDAPRKPQGIPGGNAPSFRGEEPVKGGPERRLARSRRSGDE